MNRPKILYLRGSYLNPFETQYLEPLQDEFDITLGQARSCRYDMNRVRIPRLEIPCLDYLNGIFPRRIGGKNLPNPLKYLGYEEVLFSLDSFAPNFDVIHLPEQSFYFTWQVVKAKCKHGYKVFTAQEEINPFWYLHRSAIVKRAALVRRETDLFCARTERAKKALMCEGVDPSRIRVIGHGVDTTRFHPGPRNAGLCKLLGMDLNRLVILFVGRLVWTKGIYVLADAAKVLLSDPKIKRLDPLFLIVGDGQERAKFESRLEVLGINQSFMLLGNRPYEQLPDIHRLADIFVLPSISTRFILEQFGMVLIESMATGKPVISTYCGAIDEVVGDAGILVQPNDYFTLCNAISRLCQDKDLRGQIGRRGLDRVKGRFTQHTISSAIASAYRTLLGV